MKDTILSIKDLSIRFGGIKALNNVSFDIKKGAIHSLIGPNGAGKTTVFNCCTGFYRPTSGSITFESKNGPVSIDDLVSNKFVTRDYVNPYYLTKKIWSKMFSGSHQVCLAGMARTFQNIRLFREMTVVENLLVALHQHQNWNLGSGVLNLKAHQTSERNVVEKAYFWLERLKLDGDAQTLAGQLPYGKTRKLELARSMCTDPLIICLDEPAAGLNANETEELNAVIRSLRDDFKITVFLIEHDMRMIMKISDSIVVIDHGEIIAQGNSHEIQNNEKVIEAYLGVEE